VVAELQIKIALNGGVTLSISLQKRVCLILLLVLTCIL